MKPTKRQTNGINSIIESCRAKGDEKSLNAIREMLSVMNIPTHEGKDGWLAGAPEVIKAFEVGKSYGYELSYITILSRTDKTAKIELTRMTGEGIVHEESNRNIAVDNEGIETIFKRHDSMYFWANHEYTE